MPGIRAHSRRTVCAIVENAQITNNRHVIACIKGHEQGQLVRVNPLIKLLEIEKSSSDCVAVENPAFERIHGLSEMQ